MVPGRDDSRTEICRGNCPAFLRSAGRLRDCCARHAAPLRRPGWSRCAPARILRKKALASPPMVNLGAEAGEIKGRTRRAGDERVRSSARKSPSSWRDGRTRRAMPRTRSKSNTATCAGDRRRDARFRRPQLTSIAATCASTRVRDEAKDDGRLRPGGARHAGHARSAIFMVAPE